MKMKSFHEIIKGPFSEIAIAQTWSSHCTLITLNENNDDRNRADGDWPTRPAQFYVCFP